MSRRQAKKKVSDPKRPKSRCSQRAKKNQVEKVLKDASPLVRHFVRLDSHVRSLWLPDEERFVIDGVHDWDAALSVIRRERGLVFDLHSSVAVFSLEHHAAEYWRLKVEQRSAAQRAVAGKLEELQQQMRRLVDVWDEAVQPSIEMPEVRSAVSRQGYVERVSEFALETDLQPSDVWRFTPGRGDPVRQVRAALDAMVRWVDAAILEAAANAKARSRTGRPRGICSCVSRMAFGGPVGGGDGKRSGDQFGPRATLF